MNLNGTWLVVITIIISIEGTDKNSLHKHVVNITTEAKSFLFELKHPVAFNMESLILSLIIFITILFIFIICFFVSKLIAHLSYHSIKKHIKKVQDEDEEDDLSSDFDELLWIARFQ